MSQAASAAPYPGGPNAPRRLRRPLAEQDPQEEDDMRIRLKLLEGGCPFCHRKPFYEGFYSSLCCRGGTDAAKKLLEPLPHDLASTYAREDFQRKSIQVGASTSLDFRRTSETFMVSSLERTFWNIHCFFPRRTTSSASRVLVSRENASSRRVPAGG